MKKHIILIDYENVQKHNLRPLLSHDVLIKVFHAENQKFTSEFTRLALEFGKEKFELVTIKGQGKNAADFHIAYFIGKLSREIPDPSFHIISRDTGFKVLADFLSQVEGIPCRVAPSIADLALQRTAAPAVKPAAPAGRPAAPAAKPGGGGTEDWYTLVKGKLANAKAQKPKNRKTLRNQIVSICRRKISETEAEEMVSRLVEDKVIQVRNGAVIYR
ncbi:MAG TPA: PIN domain-containing protein [Chitinivibrionales bacterium]|nr:PIN domain-containing protein [Chitinivibrionales bacterium]